MTSTVVHFTDTAGYGGAEQILLTTLAGLDRARWRPVLMHYPHEGALELAAAVRRMGMETRVVPAGTGARGIPDLPHFARVLRSEGTAILHAHLVGPLRCTKGLLAARIARVPGVLATQHLYSELPGRIGHARQRFAAGLVDHYIAVSAGTARELGQHVTTPGKVVVIPNAIDSRPFQGVDGTRLRRELIGEDTERSMVLAIARLHERKGIAYLLEAAVRLPDVVVVIAGDGPEMEPLKSRAHELGIAERVRFLGTRNDVPDLLAACDLLVLPSFSEGLPVCVIEAMMAERAVVATDIPGTDEVVVPGETGLLVPPGDAAALARGIGTLLGDATARRRMAAAGRRRAEERFSAEAMIGRIESLYEDVLSRRGSLASAREHAASPSPG